MRRQRVSFLMILDVGLIVAAYILALYLRFDGKIEGRYLYTLLDNIAAIIIIKLLIFYAFNLYRSLWKYASIDELIEVVGASIIANLVVMIYMSYFKADMPRSIYVMVPLIDMALIGGSRFAYRVFRRVGLDALNSDGYEKRILIVGAGEAGAMVIKELRNHKNLNSKPIAIIDDNPSKKRQHINGVPVVGNRKDIGKVCEKKRIDEIIIAIPSDKREDLKDIVSRCKKTKCKTKILPGYYELIDGKVNVTKIRDVEIEDLLGRDEVELNIGKICHYIEGKRVLITGGGGSIGSELCRQVARFNPGKLLILDIYENNAYDIQNELLREYDDLDLEVIIASVRDAQRLEEIFKAQDIDVVFHAAAHKHVPLMERNPKEAVKNNIFGTWNLVKVADEHRVDKFVLISTDKAVNPTNVMGATKRVAEMIIQMANKGSHTDYVAVRFGNVLGSNGSVIPLFKRQIEAGGPVTVTHPEVIRYFMTIPEACQLVLQAGGMAKGGEIFILDMGEPVKILDLAKDLIRLSGFEPGKDIPIEITGLRPGEKLYEELLLDKEKSATTDHQKIFIEKPLFYDYIKMNRILSKLKETIDYADEDIVKNVLAEIVPTYKPYKGTGKKDGNTVVDIHSLSETAMAADTTEIN